VEEVPADHQPRLPGGGVKRPEIFSRGEELLLFEHAESRQINFAVDMQNAPGREERRRIVILPLLPFLDKADDKGQPPAGRDQLPETGVPCRIEGRFLGQVPELVSGQAQLGKDEKIGFFLEGFFDLVEMKVVVAGRTAQAGSDLRQTDSHDKKISTFQD